MHLRLFTRLLQASAAVTLVVSLHAAASADSSVPRPAYDPSQIYPGPFMSNNLYLKPSPRGNWVRGINGTFPEAVTCPDAVRHLKRTGRWQGHLNPDGSCGPLGEPSSWATGNRINYEGPGSLR